MGDAVLENDTCVAKLNAILQVAPLASVRSNNTFGIKPLNNKGLRDFLIFSSIWHGNCLFYPHRHVRNRSGLRQCYPFGVFPRDATRLISSFQQRKEAIAIMSKKSSKVAAGSQAARRVTCLALVALLVFTANFSENNAFGQEDFGPYHIYIDGRILEGRHTNPGNFWWHNNNATVDNLIINGGNVGNAHSAFPHNPTRPSVINYASVTGTHYATSQLNNAHSGHIGTVDIFNRGVLGNGHLIIGWNPTREMHSTVGTANVHTGGQLNSGSQARTEIVNVLGGRVQNAARDGNRPGFNQSTIGTLNLYTGTVTSGDHGGIGTANVHGGRLDNMNNSTIDTMNLSGGTVNNDSRINNLHYTGGFYSVQRGAAGTWWGNEWSGDGVIGNLNVAADSTGIDWSFVNNLSFDSNNAGLISLAGYDSSDHVGFRNIHVTDYADLRYGGLSLDLSGVSMGNFDTFSDWTLGLVNTFGDAWSYTFSWEHLLGTDNVAFWDDLRYVELVWGSSTAVLFDGNAWRSGWSVSGAGISTVVPEPATLAIVGLGLAGLGLARRRGKKE